MPSHRHPLSRRKGGAERGLPSAEWRLRALAAPRSFPKRTPNNNSVQAGFPQLDFYLLVCLCPFVCVFPCLAYKINLSPFLLALFLSCSSLPLVIFPFKFLHLLLAPPASLPPLLSSLPSSLSLSYSLSLSDHQCRQKCTIKSQDSPRIAALTLAISSRKKRRTQP